MPIAEELCLEYLLCNLVEPVREESEESEGEEKVERKVRQLEPIHVETFEDLLDHYAEQNFDIRNLPNTRDTLAVMLATAITQYMGGNEMILLYVRGAPSCLSENTEVIINRAGNGKRITLRDLYHRFHGGIASGKIWRDDIPTMIQQRQEDGTIRCCRILDVIYSGRKMLYQITTETGKQIEASADHLFMTDKGWKRLKNLKVGSNVLCNSGQSSGKEIVKRKAGVCVGNLIYHPFASNRNASKIRNRFRVLKSRLIVEAYLNGVSLNDHIHNLRKNPDYVFTPIPKTSQVHHKNRDYNDNSIDNLEIIPRGEHQKLHSEEDNSVTHVLYKTKSERIISITEKCVGDVYDLSVESPHNFLANGFVVHNSGKSTLCEAVSANRNICFPLSSFTGFHSGMKTKSKKNLSPAELMRNKCVVIKDYTSTILGLPDAMQKQMHGDLRDLTDGSSEAVYKNGVKRHISGWRISMIGGVTDEIQNTQNAALGSRFISVDIMDKHHGSHAHVSGALSSIAKSILASFQKKDKVEGDGFKATLPPDKMEMIKRYTSGYLLNCYNRFLTMDEPNMPQDFIEKVASMAILVGKVRAEVKRKSIGNEIAYRPRAEIGIRLGAQLLKLSTGLAVVLDRRETDNEILKIIRKVSKDTAEGFNFDIVKAICNAQTSGLPGMDKTKLHRRLDLPSGLIGKRLEDMRVVGLVEHPPSNNGSTNHIWRIKPSLLPLWKDLNGEVLTKKVKKV